MTEHVLNLVNSFFAESLPGVDKTFLSILLAICLTAILRSHIFSTIISSILGSLLVDY
jgi:hypothetical protein